MIASSNLGHITIQLDLENVLDAFKIVQRIKALCYQQLNEHRSQDVESTLKSLCQLISIKQPPLISPQLPAYIGPIMSPRNN